MKMNPVVHFELPAEDRKRIADFYTKAFGWKIQMLGEEMKNYSLATTAETDEKGMVKTPGTINGGFFLKTKDVNSHHPSVVIAVDDIKEAMKKVKAAGGKMTSEPQPIPGVGQFATFTDTEGNHLSIMQPNMPAGHK